MNCEPQENIGFGTILNALLDRAESNNMVPVCFKLPEIIIMLCDLTLTHETTWRVGNTERKIPIDITSGNKVVLICEKGILEYKVSITIAD